MIETFTQQKDMIYFIISISGIVLSFFIKFIMDWRHKICFDYISKRDVSINILQERFIGGIMGYIKNVIDEMDNQKISLELILKRPGHIKLISGLSKNGEKITRVNNTFKILEICSSLLLIISWVIFTILMTWLFMLILRFSNNTLNQAGIIITLICVFFIITLVVIMFIFDQIFFKIVNKIIQPEVL